LLLCDPRSGRRWLFDATPDLRDQLAFADGHPATRKPAIRENKGARPPLFEGIFLTHAHIGHYTGLMYLGRESYGAKGVPVHGSERMLGFLRKNGPWSQLVSIGNIVLRPLSPDTPVMLGADLSVTAFAVVHRDEFSDTVGFVIRGPSRALLYLPDIDKWSRWGRRIEDEIGKVDIALLDGTFYADGEIPGRAMSEIPHPFIRESLARFARLPDTERRKIVFTHLNHTNPASSPDSQAAMEIRRASMRVAREGQIFGL
jgi:pyrroloquinoline quinone biosynthesis protein B